MMDGLSRRHVRDTVALCGEICDHPPQIIDKALLLDCEFVDHCQTNAVRQDEMPPDRAREAIHATVERTGRATG